MTMALKTRLKRLQDKATTVGNPHGIAITVTPASSPRVPFYAIALAGVQPREGEPAACLSVSQAEAFLAGVWAGLQANTPDCSRMINGWKPMAATHDTHIHICVLRKHEGGCVCQCGAVGL